MKVYIGPYVHRWVSNFHSKYMEKKYGILWDGNQTKFEHFLEKLEDVFQWVYNKTINLYLDNKKRKIKVQLDYYDTWSMDDTLSVIILPMLKQLKATQHGGPFTDDSDVPEELRSTSAKPLTDDQQACGETDEFFFDRWNWILDEMIWAFEEKVKDSWPEAYYDYIPDTNEPLGIKFTRYDEEGRRKHQERISNGFRLFGKYYESLWD